MPITRRHLLPLVAAGLAAPSIVSAQNAAQSTATPVQTAAWESERAVGSPTAKTTVEEWFSLTCTHCAHFAQETYPQVESDLIKTGKVRWVFRDFPLDRVALQAAMVARALPPDRYQSFVLALFASQDRWAFTPGVDYTKELWNMAALDGMTRATFDAAINDTALQDWILAQQSAAEKKYGIDATPSFVINGKKYSGQMAFGDFVKLLPDVS
jgi:protein-disulfide isomerase